MFYFLVLLLLSLVILSLPLGVHACVDIDRSDLEREVAELRAQLRKASVLSEVEELRRALDCKEKEILQLSVQVKVRITEIDRRMCVMPSLSSSVFSVSPLEQRLPAWGPKITGRGFFKIGLAHVQK